MKVDSRKENDELVIELRFDAHEQLCLSHDLEDIVAWYSSGPSLGKIHNCRARMIKENKDELMKSPELQSLALSEVNKILADEKALCEAICKLPSYKNRVQREAELKG